jgi:nitroreductase
MNETLKNITERYSCRDFADTPLTDGQIEALVNAALAAPSARNLQPWHITVVKDKKLIDELDAAGMEVLSTEEDKTFYDLMMQRGGKMFYDAPFVIVITTDGSKWGMLDSGILCQNVVLAAESMGLGTCIAGLLNVPLGGPRGDEFKKRLEFKDGYEFAVGVLVGTIKSGKKPHELDFTKVTYIN